MSESQVTLWLTVATVVVGVVAAWAAILAVRRSDRSIRLSEEQLALAKSSIPRAVLHFDFVETDRRFSNGAGTYDPNQYMLTSVTILNTGTEDARDLKAYASSIEGDDLFETMRLLSHRDAGGWIVQVPINRVHWVQVYGTPQLQRHSSEQAPIDTELRVTYKLPGSDDVHTATTTLHFHEND